MTKILTVLIATILLASCSVTRKAERQGIEKAQKNIKAYEVVFPTLFESTFDTTYVLTTDTVLIESYGVDTVLSMVNDTVFFENEKVRIQFIKTDIDTVFITKVLVKEQAKEIQSQIKIIRDTKYVTVPAEIIYKIPFWYWIMVFGLVLILIKKIAFK
jgi:hypothetical protein